MTEQESNEDKRKNQSLPSIFRSKKFTLPRDYSRQTIADHHHREEQAIRQRYWTQAGAKDEDRDRYGG